MLNINGTICNDAETIAQEFNDYFCNTVTNMSDDEQSICDGECVKDIYDDFEYHESILSIKSRNYPIDAFSFEEVNEDVVLKLVRSLDGNKATGHDNIPAALLKSAAEELALPIEILINRSIRDAQLPHDLKLSEIPQFFLNLRTILTKRTSVRLVSFHASPKFLKMFIMNNCTISFVAYSPHPWRHTEGTTDVTTYWQN